MHPVLTNVDLVVFDLDGTLIDSAPDLSAAVDAMLADYALPPAGIDKVRGWVGNGSRKLVERALAAHENDGAVIDTRQAHDAFIRHYGAAPCAYTRLYAGARQSLQMLAAHGFTLALVTNKPADFLPPILAHLQIDTYFALILGGDSLDRKKPDPAPLLHAADVLHVAPERGLMIGDSRHDIAAGKAAGFRTLAVTYGYNHGQPIEHSQPDHAVDCLLDLLG